MVKSIVASKPATVDVLGSNCAEHKLGNVVLVRTRPSVFKAVLIVFKHSLCVKSHVKNAFSRGSPSVDAASSFSLKLLILCVMLRTSTWY